MLTPGIPGDLDDESLARLARSFYVVKMVRYAGLLVAALLLVAACAVTDAPAAVTSSLVVLSLALAAAMLVIRQRYVSSRRPRPRGPSSPSPTG